jgi:ketol-acid reductoisomerase
MTAVYHDQDGNADYLSGKRVGIIGYGNMGRPVALNLRDSGVQVWVSEPRPEKRREATDEGFTPVEVIDLVAASDILMPLLRDEAMPRVYLEHVSPHLRRGQTLIFSSAYNLTFGFIEAPPFVDVGLVSARTVGAAVRDRYVSGAGFASFVAVAQDASRNAWTTILAVAKAMGALRGGAVEIRFEQETELGLFLQQAVLPMLHHVVMTAAEMLMRIGYPPEAVFTELYLSGATADYLKQAATSGLMGALQNHALTAQYGALSRFERFNDLKVERLMEITLDEIRSGKFAQEWSREYDADYPRLRTLLQKRLSMELWEMEQQTIELLKGE